MRAPGATPSSLEGSNSGPLKKEVESREPEGPQDSIETLTPVPVRRGANVCRAEAGTALAAPARRASPNYRATLAHLGQVELTTISSPPGDWPLLVRWCPMWQWSTHLPFGSVKTTS